MPKTTLASLALVLVTGSLAAQVAPEPVLGSGSPFTPVSEDLGIAALDEETFVVAYLKGHSIGDAAVRAAKVAPDGTVTYGPEVVFSSSSGTPHGIEIAALDASRFVIARTAGVQNLSAIVGDVTGTSITLGAMTSLDAKSNGQNSLDVLDADRFLVSYLDFGTPRARVCGVSGTAITLGAEADLSDRSFPATLTVLDADRFLTTYSDGTVGRLRVGQVTGTSAITLGPEAPFALPGIPAMDALDPSRVVLVYRSSGADEFVRIAEIAGTTVTTLGPPAVLDPDPSHHVGVTAVEALDDASFVVTYFNGWYYIGPPASGCQVGDCLYRSQIGTVDGLTISGFGDAALLDPASSVDQAFGSNLLDQAALGTTGSFVVSYAVPGIAEGVVRVSEASGSCTFRDGSGINPGGFTSATAPVAGQTWTAAVDATPASGGSTLATLVGIGLGGPTAGAFVGGFELLVLPPFLQDSASGAHAIPIPPTIPVGLAVATQGARLELPAAGAPIAVLLNALDLKVGG